MEVSRKSFLEALEPLKSAISSRSSVVETTQIWFDGQQAYAYDGGLGISTKLEMPFKFGVTGKLLLELLSSATSENLVLETADDNLVVNWGKSRVKLVTLPFERCPWPYARGGGKPDTVFTASEAFLAAMRQAFLIRPTNPRRMEHYAVCVYPMNQELEVCITDSKSIALAIVEESLEGKQQPLAIPRVFAEQLVSQCKDSPSVLLYFDHFEVQANERVALFSNVFDTSSMLNIPKTAAELIEGMPPSFAVPKEFWQALNTAVIVAGNEEPVVTLQVEDRTLHLKGTFGRGQLNEEFILAEKASKASIKVVAKSLLLAEKAQYMTLSEKVIILVDDAGLCFILAAWGGDDKG